MLFEYKHNDLVYFTLDLTFPTEYSNDFTLYETVSWNADSDIVEEQEEYLKGYIKSDGCSQIELINNHICGVDSWKLHCKVMEWLYKTVTSNMPYIFDTEKRE